MEENKERIEELENRIKEWKTELETVWNGKNTDAAEVERRNLRNLIRKNQQELDKLQGKEPVVQEVKEVGDTIKEIKELKEQIEEESKNITRDINRLKNELERLEEEKEIYESQKNDSYKGIYEEYNKKIEEIQKELKEKEEKLKETEDKINKYYQENMDIILRSLTQGRINIEKEIKEIQEQIEKKQEEVEKIPYGTEEAFEEVELEDGTKERRAKVHILYEEISKLQSQLKDKQKGKEEIEELIQEVKGEKDKAKTDFNQEHNAEVTKFFHGQGDIPEITRDDTRGNDEYFGFEGNGKNKGENESTRSRKPVPPEPNPDPSKPVPPKPNPDPSKPVPPGPDPDPSKPTPPTPPNGTLPVRSGLQVYRDLLNEVGYIKGTKAIAAHDFINKFNFFGINKFVAWGIRKVTGRKEEIERIEEILDEIQAKDPNDFELLIKDFLLKDNDTRNIMKYKVNEILLEAVAKKCNKDFANNERAYSEYEYSLRRTFEEKQTELQHCSPEEKTSIESQLITLGGQIQKINGERQELEMRGRRIQEGREDKSYDRKSNIIGGLRANRNPDNRKEINELADIELVKLRAEKTGDDLARVQAQKNMDEYAHFQTSYWVSGGKERISKGAFDAKEGDIKVITHTKNMTPELLGSISMIATSAGLGALATIRQQHLNQEKVNQAVQKAEENVNNQIDAINEAAKAKNSVNISEDLVASGKDSLSADAIKVSSMGERAADLGSDYHISSGKYVNLDELGVARATKIANEAREFKPTGATTLEQFAEVLRKKAELAQKGDVEAMKKIQEAARTYYNTHQKTISDGGIEHAITAALEQNASNYASSNVDLNNGLADLFEGISKLTPEEIEHIAIDSPEVGKSFIPLIAGLIPGISLTAKEQVEGRKERDLRADKRENNTITNNGEDGR